MVFWLCRNIYDLYIQGEKKVYINILTKVHLEPYCENSLLTPARGAGQSSYIFTGKEFSIFISILSRCMETCDRQTDRGGIWLLCVGFLVHAELAFEQQTVL